MFLLYCIKDGVLCPVFDLSSNYFLQLFANYMDVNIVLSHFEVLRVKTLKVNIW